MDHVTQHFTPRKVCRPRFRAQRAIQTGNHERRVDAIFFAFGSPTAVHRINRNIRKTCLLAKMVLSMLQYIETENIPVVPRKAVAEVSKMENLWER